MMKESSGNPESIAYVQVMAGKRARLEAYLRVPTRNENSSPRWRRTKHYTSECIHSLATGLHSTANTIDGIHGLMSPVKSYSEGRVSVTTMYRFTVGKDFAQETGFTISFPRPIPRDALTGQSLITFPGFTITRGWYETSY